LQVTHPFDSFVAVEALAKQNIYDILVNGHIAVCRDRLNILVQTEQRARQMDLEEQQWKSTLPKHMQEVNGQTHSFAGKPPQGNWVSGLGSCQLHVAGC